MQKTFTQDIFNLSCPWDNQYQGSAPRIVFVCSAGLLRSATAATLASQRGVNARNCGSHTEYALVPLSVNLIFWGQKLVFVNIDNYLRAREMFFGDKEALDLLDKKKVIWNIEDNFEYMNEHLQKVINSELDKLLA